MLSNSEVADILERAADIYEAEQYGWCRESFCLKSYDTGQLSICAMTALALAARFIYHQHLDYAGIIVGDLIKNEDPVLMQLVDTLQVPDCCPTHKKFKLSYQSEAKKVIDWNDCSDQRTKQDVIDLFKDAAKRLRNEA